MKLWGHNEATQAYFYLFEQGKNKEIVFCLSLELKLISKLQAGQDLVYVTSSNLS